MPSADDACAGKVGVRSYRASKNTWSPKACRGRMCLRGVDDVCCDPFRELAKHDSDDESTELKGTGKWSAALVRL